MKVKSRARVRPAPAPKTSVSKNAYNGVRFVVDDTMLVDDAIALEEIAPEIASGNNRKLKTLRDVMARMAVDGDGHRLMHGEAAKRIGQLTLREFKELGEELVKFFKKAKAERDRAVPPATPTV